MAGVSRRARACACLAAALMLAAPPPRAGSQEQTGPQIRVATISPYTDARHRLRVVVQVLNTSEIAIEGVELRVEIYSRLLSRSQLRGALDEGPNTGLLRTETEPLGEPLAPGVQREIFLQREVETLRDALTRNGVYPLGIVVRWSGGETRLTTALPHFAEAPEFRLNVAWLLPVARPVGLRGDGTYAEDALAGLALDELRQQMDVIGARPGAPVTLVPQGATVDMLADLADGFTRADGSAETGDDGPLALAATTALDAMRRAAAGVGELASTTYTDADLSALAGRGLRSDVVRQIAEDRRAIEQRLDRTPSFRFLVPPGLVAGAGPAGTLGTLGIEGLLLDPADLPQPPPTPADLPELRYDLFGPSRPVVVAAGVTRFGALLVDPDLRARLDGPEQGVLLAQAVIAETAGAWNELPSLSDRRLLVLSSSALPTPPALAAALDGLTGAPWITLRTASDALAAVIPSGEALPLPRLRRQDTPFLAAARAARRALQTLATVAIEPHARAAEWERMILLAESAQWELAPTTGAALGHAVAAGVGEVTGGVRVAAGRLVTLTSRAGVVPVTVLNEAGVPMRVQVRVFSPKVTFPDGDRRTVELRGQTTIDFPVEARATGSFPVEVLIESSDGSVLIARGSVALRSTAVSAVALAAVGGSALFLIVAWVRRIRRRRDGAGRGGTAMAAGGRYSRPR